MKITEDGKKYYNAREIGEMIGRSRQTIVNWDKYSTELEEKGRERLIPKPCYRDGKKQRFWIEYKIKDIKNFCNNLKRGDMAEFNRRLWGAK